VKILPRLAEQFGGLMLHVNVALVNGHTELLSVQMGMRYWWFIRRHLYLLPHSLEVNHLTFDLGSSFHSPSQKIHKELPGIGYKWAIGVISLL